MKTEYTETILEQKLDTLANNYEIAIMEGNKDEAKEIMSNMRSIAFCLGIICAVKN
jgi:hypothetical protein